MWINPWLRVCWADTWQLTHFYPFNTLCFIAVRVGCRSVLCCESLAWGWCVRGRFLRSCCKNQFNGSTWRTYRNVFIYYNKCIVLLPLHCYPFLFAFFVAPPSPHCIGRPSLMFPSPLSGVRISTQLEMDLIGVFVTILKSWFVKFLHTIFLGLKWSFAFFYGQYIYIQSTIFIVSRWTLVIWSHAPLVLIRSRDNWQKYVRWASPTWV